MCTRLWFNVYYPSVLQWWGGGGGYKHRRARQTWEADAARGDWFVFMDKREQPRKTFREVDCAAK